MRVIRNIKYALDDILDRFFLSFIIMIQLTVSIVFLYAGLNMSYSNINNLNRIKESYNIGNIHKINVLSDIDNLLDVKIHEKDFSKRVNEFNTYLNNNSDFKCAILNNDSVFVKNFSNSGDFQGIIKEKIEVNNNKYILVNTLRGNKNYFSHFNYQISDGRYFNDDDFKAKDNIPIILGSDYKDKYNVGDKISSIDEKYTDIRNAKEIKFEVIGFLKEDQYFFQKTFSPEGVFCINNYILYPICELENISNDDDSYEFISKFFDTVILSDKDDEYLSAEINNKTDNLDLFKIDLFDGSQIFKSKVEECNNQIIYSVIIFLIVILFTSINMITSMIGYIFNKKKEFSINIMVGAKMSDLVQRIVFQNVIIMIFSAIFASFVVKVFNLNSLVGINYEVIILTSIICVILVLLMSIIPILKLFSLDFNSTSKED